MKTWNKPCVLGRALFVVLVALQIVGCAGSTLAPNSPDVIDGHRTYTIADYDTASKKFDEELASGNVGAAIRARDQMVWRSIADVNGAYFRFRNQFHENREITNTAMDAALLGMSAASTVLGGSAVLSAAVTALQGFDLSVEKNFFRERTSELLFTTMEGLRQEQLALIMRSLLLPATEYGFEAAFNDVVVLFYKGTVIAALQKLTAVAGEKSEAADQEVKAAAEMRVERTLSVISDAAVEKKRRLGSIIGKLIADDTNVANMEAVKVVLRKSGETVAATVSIAQLKERLRALMRKADDDTKVDALIAVFKEAGVWKE